MDLTATTFKGELTVLDTIPASPPANRCPQGDPSLRRSGMGRRRVPVSQGQCGQGSDKDGLG